MPSVKTASASAAAVALLAPAAAFAGSPPQTEPVTEPEVVLEQPAEAAAADKAWEFEVMPYLFAPSINGDASLGNVDIGVDVGPKTIIENLEAAFMGRVDARHESGWGLYMDYSLMNLGKGMSLPGGAGSIVADIDQQVLDFAATYRVAEGQDTIDVYGGIRYWDLGLDVVAPGPLGVDRDESWVDPMIGARWQRELNEDWNFIAQGDIGGFGVGSDFAWMAAAGVSYEGWENVSLVAMYRATSVDYETSDFKYDTVTTGPLIGASFKF